MDALESARVADTQGQYADERSSARCLAGDGHSRRTSLIGAAVAQKNGENNRADNESTRLQGKKKGDRIRVARAEGTTRSNRAESQVYAT